MKILAPPSSGSIGGTTFSHNRAGQYTRNRRKPVVGTATPRQAVIKANLTASSQSWQNLTVPQQAAWTAYANGHPITDALGQSIKLTGHQYFVKCAAALLNAGQAIPTLPPASDVVSPVVLVGFNVNDTPSVGIKLTAGAAGGYILVAIAKVTSLGVNFQKTFTQVAVVASDATSVDITDALIAVSGLPTTSNKAWLRLTPVNAGGMTGTPLIVQTAVVNGSLIAIPVTTSPVATQATATWVGAPTPAIVQYQSGPANDGPFGVIGSEASAASPVVIMGLITGQYVRTRLQDPATNLFGQWSTSHPVT